ncbi:hypothetical protein [Modestobacter sp. I12A-02662]|uniref:hypothetical protein n=1 Tax=Modestobacter sp. I12A-02662 TaxID=1730496 RepID=UPI0034DF9E32
MSGAERVVTDLRARGHFLCLAYADVVLALCCQDAAVTEWVERFCEGYFTPSAGRVEDVGIYATADPALLAVLRCSTSHRPAGGKYGYVETPLTDSVTLVRKSAGKSEDDDVYLLLFRERRQILLIAPDDVEVQREEVMQVLRAAGKWLLIERGWIPMHSACAAKNGRAVCVAGEKASGKTSTLLNLLARNGCDLVAPDKFLLREDAQRRLEVCGVPGKIGVRVGSVVVQPRLLDWLAREEAPFFPHLSPQEVQRIAETNTPEQLRDRKEKVPLLPTELAGLFGGSIVPTAPLGLLLLPVFDPSLDESRLVRVDPDQAIAVLSKSYVSLLSKAEGFLLTFFDLQDTLLEERLAALLDEHLPGAPAYEVHQSHTTNEQTAELVEALL